MSARGVASIVAVPLHLLGPRLNLRKSADQLLRRDY